MTATEETVEDFLEHFGKKGMKWGVRNTSRSTNRELNKASRAKEKVKRTADFNKVRENLRPSAKTSSHNLNTKEGRQAARTERTADIDRARERIRTGAHRADAKEAKSEFKKDKLTIGSREARKILRGKRSKLYSDVNRSKEARDGFEATTRILNSISESLKDSRRQ